MKYNELKEMTIKEWDGEPFEAYVVQCKNVAVTTPKKVRINGVLERFWVSDEEVTTYFKFAYPVKWNEKKVDDFLNPKKKRMTERQLAMWLAKGKGEFVKEEFNHLAFASHNYVIEYADTEVSDGWKVRKWGSEEWIEPTVDLLEDC